MIKFLTFGDGDKGYKDASIRLCKQAKMLNIFDFIENNNYTTLSESFKKKHGEFILNNKRGFGYWIWKSYIIDRTMKTSKNGDIILYLDAGCELTKSKKNALIRMITDKVYIHDSTVNTIEKKAPGTNYVWTKGDVIDHMKITNETILNSLQHQAGAILFKVNDMTRMLVDEWALLCENHKLINDSPSVIPNHHQHKEHRHDQSIYSLLLLKMNISNKTDIRDGVHYKRNRSGKSHYA